jgi:hypothetical protein
MLRRSIKRIPTAFEAGATRGNGHVKNVSKEGIFVRSSTLPDPGTEIRLIFHDRHGSKLEVRGLVRWTTTQLPDGNQAKPGFGVQLTGRPEGYMDFYEQILTR